MKAAISRAFPEVQQQLCIWHIQKNVLKNLSQKWATASSALSTASSAPPTTSSTSLTISSASLTASFASPTASSASPIPLSSSRIANLARPNLEQLEAQATSSVDHTCVGLLQMWVRVCWAKDIDTMRQRWVDLCYEFESDQPSKYFSLLKTLNNIMSKYSLGCIRYLQGQWLPRGRQFLYCFTKQYRNFGIMSSQGSEAQHFSSKVFFDDNLSDLHTLLSRLQK